MPNTQIFRGAPATITTVLLDQYGQPRSAGMTTVTIKRSNGDAIVTNASTSNGEKTGVKQFTLTPAQTNTLDALSVVWQEASGATIEHTIEVVGGYYFTLDEARDAGPNLADRTKYSNELVIAARRFVEDECEAITHRAFVPRFELAKLSGNDRDTIWLPRPDVRTIRSLGVRDLTGVFYVDGLDNLRIDAAGRLTTPLGSFVYGVHNHEVAYEYGFDAPPQQIKTAALVRLRDILKWTKTGAPDLATFQIVEGRVFGIPQPGVRGSHTGIPEVDKAYDDWTFSRGSTASVPYGG